MPGPLQTNEKTERLLNLVLALLGTRRYLKKSEIIKVIPGYEGSPEARERMFERDKDELRKIGIQIDVSQLDPLFEDEVGYRILRDDYIMELPKLTAEEGVIANLALQLVAKVGITESLHSALMRIGAHSITESSEIEQIFALTDLLDSTRSEVLAACLSAIRSHRELHFRYQRELDGQILDRRVRPIRLEMRGNQWHLITFDMDRDDSRTFLIDNILDQPRISTEEFDPRKVPLSDSAIPMTRFLARVDSAQVPALELEGGVPVQEERSRSVMEFNVYDVEQTLRVIIGVDAKAEILEPLDLIPKYEAIQQRIIDAYR